MSSSTVAIILAGGKGVRFGENIPKQFAKLSGKTVIEHTIRQFERHPLIDSIFVVVHPDHLSRLQKIVSLAGFSKVTKILTGGPTRQLSVSQGIAACDTNVSTVLIHDGVRPFVTGDIITSVVEALGSHAAVDVVVPTADTIVQMQSGSELIAGIPDRQLLRRGQTPQGFRLSVIRAAHQHALVDGFQSAVDDCSLVMRYLHCPVYVVPGSQLNMKISYPEDLYIAERIFQMQTVGCDRQLPPLIGLRDKVIVVLGGFSGIGEQVCLLAEQSGARVYACSRRSGVDVTDPARLEEYFSQLVSEAGGIDLVVVTAGVLCVGSLLDLGYAQLAEQVRVNLVGSMFAAKAALPHLARTAGGLLLFTSSSYTRGRAGYAAYSASKAGVVNMCQALSDEVAQLGVRVNVICPERTATPMRLANFGDEPGESLLPATVVAQVALTVALSDLTGQVIDVRKQDQKSRISDESPPGALRKV